MKATFTINSLIKHISTQDIDFIVVDMVSHHLLKHDNSNYLPKVLRYSSRAHTDICHNDPQDMYMSFDLYHLTVQRYNVIYRVR